MNREDIIRMAIEAGWQYAHGDSGYEPLWAFAALVASAERSACAEQLDALGCDHCADAIRARENNA